MLQMEALDSFQDKFLMLLAEMEEKVKQRACILKYLHMVSDMNLCEQMRDLLLDNKEAEEANPMCIIRYLAKQGVQDGVIGKIYQKEYVETVIFSKMIAFVMYVDNDFEKGKCNIEEMKQQLYAGLCRELAD